MRCIWLPFILVTYLQSFMVISATELPSVTKLANLYLKSFPLEEVSTHLTNIHNTESRKKNNIGDIYLSTREQCAIVLNELFAKSDLYIAKYKRAATVLNPYVWNDLNLFCGTTTTPQYHFLSRINNTITALGDGALASLVSTPIVDIKELTRRQQVIALLKEDYQLQGTLKKQLQHYQKCEKRLLSFWTPTDPLYSPEFNKYLTQLFYTKSPTRNKSARCLQTRKFLRRDVWDIYINYVWEPIIGALTGELTVLTSGAQHRWYYKNIWPGFLPIWGPIHVYRRCKKNNDPQGIILPQCIAPSLATIHSLWQWYMSFSNYREYAGVLNSIALRMADLQEFLILTRKINDLVCTNPKLERLYGDELSATRALIKRYQEKSEIGNLLRYLSELPLYSWSYFRNNAGKLLASLQIFKEYKAVFHDVMYEIGQVDAFLSMAILMEKTAMIGTQSSYTFTKFLSRATYMQPRLELSDMWNCFLKPSEAIGNSIIMDAATGVQHIILTGPNAGGKSTFSKGVVQAILLSQTFGICPAKFCAMTPFHKISTYIDVTDDIAAGKSLFLAEVTRFQQHLDVLKLLKENEFSFTIFDEPFSGTNPKEGAAAEYSVLNFIAQYKNTLNVVATHYPKMILLEEKESAKGFKNYKVCISYKGKDKKIVYPYKIVPGASNQMVAIDILTEQGYAADLLKEARAIINCPKKYKKSFVSSR